MQEVRPL